MVNINYLNNFEFSYLELEEQLKNFNLNFYFHKDSYVENFNFNPNYFVYSFYDFISLNKKIPTQKEYAQYYIEKNITSLSKTFLIHYKLNKQYLIKNLIYRLYRAYPSFIRDFHFSIYLTDKLKSREISYNPFLDVMKGIDILIDAKYAIHLYTNTKRAKYYRNKKYNRHSKDDYTHIDIPIDFKKSYKCGNFFLYRDNEIQILLNELSKLEKIRI